MLKDLEARFQSCLEALNQAPLLVDQKQLYREHSKTGLLMDTFRLMMEGASKKRIDPESTEQLRTYLYQDLKLPVFSRTPKGTASVDTPTVLRLQRELDRSFLRYLLSYREVASAHKHLKTLHSKMKDGYVYPELSNHCSTLRLYSYLITMAEDGKRCILPGEGHVFVQADYRQQELAIVACLAGETGLAEAIAAGEDPHELTARQLFTSTTMTEKEREVGKQTNYAILYQTTPDGLAWHLGIPRDEAEALIQRWYRGYPRIEAWIASQKAFLEKNGYTESAFGLKSYIRSGLPKGKAYDKEVRRCLNALIQSVGSVFLKQAVIRAFDVGLDVVLPRHDALVVRSQKGHVDRTIRQLRDAMVVTWMSNQFDVEVQVGTTIAMEKPTEEEAKKCSGI